MVGLHHGYNEHELGQTPGDDEGQGGLACCSPLDRKESGHDWAPEQQQQKPLTTATWSLGPELSAPG